MKAWITLPAALLILYVGAAGAQSFRPSDYNKASNTAGIQEAIDAAAKAGGGTVQIPAGTFVLHAGNGRPALLLRSRVTLAGAGAASTILRLEAQSKVYQAAVANQSYANPDAAEPDHDIALRDLTLDLDAPDQVTHETQLSHAIAAAGEQQLVVRSEEGLTSGSLLLVDPGPNQEIVPVGRLASGSLRAELMHSHPEGARVVQLVDRLHGLALVGVSNMTVEGVTITHVPMDGIYVTNTMDGVHRKTYSRGITIRHSNFIACHRNGISIIDADNVTIENNQFQDISGSPGSPVDVEPNYPEQHGSRILIRGNQVSRCYRGISLSLQFSGPHSSNFSGERITGNTVKGTLYGWGIYVLMQHAGGMISRNIIDAPAGDGILVVGSYGIQVTQNVITNAGRCHTTGNCNHPLTAAGIRLVDGTGGKAPITRNVVTGNTIEDTQPSTTLLYGIDYSSVGTGNIIRENTVKGFDRLRGAEVHTSGDVR